MASSSFTCHILHSYTIPYTILLTLYIAYLVIHIFRADLGLSPDDLTVIIEQHYLTALVYAVHKVVVEHKSTSVLRIIGECFFLFPLHFIHTMYKKIATSRQLLKLNSESAETSSLLDKTQLTSPLHTYIIMFTCLQIPIGVFNMMRHFIVGYGESSTRSSFQLCHLTISLLLMTWGAVFYFRYETHNMSRLSFEQLKQVLQLESQDAETFSSDLYDPVKKPKGVDEFKLKVTPSHGSILEYLVILLVLLHCYVRLLCMGLAFFEKDKITGFFIVVQTVLFSLILFVCNFRKNLSIFYVILQSFLLNFCMVEYKIRFGKVLFAAYFLLMALENLYFGYLFYTGFSWPYWEEKAEYRPFFNAVYRSLIAAQELQLCLVIIYLISYKAKVYEVDVLESCDYDKKSVTERLLNVNLECDLPQVHRK